MGITSSDAKAVAAVWGATLARSGITNPLRVEGNKVIGENSGFCPTMAAVHIMNAPWEIVCSTCAWPFMEGDCSSQTLL
jgi:hypothetical protein